MIDYGVGFGRFRFDLQDGRLWAGTKEIRLTPKASAVLKVLVTHAGAPVKKEALFASVWSDTIVGDDALTSCIQELRKALADDAKQPQYIETRHRKGYQFIAPLSGDVARAKSVAPTLKASAAEDLSAIAVLPFADLSPGRDQDYLCEGFAEELINALTHIEGLRVASRTACFQYRGAGADAREVGRALRVGTLLEGSVRKANNHLRVTVQLVEVSSGHHRWSQRFDRTLDDVFAIQDEIANSVAASLRGDVLSPREQQAVTRPQTGTAAYEYYLRGRQCLPRMTAVDLRKSAEMLDRAVALDANYAPAYVGLAMAHATLHEWFGAKDEDRVRAERASERALELAPDLAEAHVAHGCALSLSRRYDEAGHEFEQAVRLNPNLFDAYYYHARTAFAQGEIARSADLFKKAVGRPPGRFPEPDAAGAVAGDARAYGGGGQGDARGHPSCRTHPRAEPDRRAGVVAGIGRAVLGRSAGARAGVVEALAGVVPHRSEHVDERRVPAGEDGEQGGGARSAGACLRARVGQARLGGARSGLRDLTRRPAVHAVTGAVEVVSLNGWWILGAPNDRPCR